MSPRNGAPRLTRDQETPLVERLRAGDRTAHSELVLRYQSLLMNRAMDLLHDRALAEDVVQDTWLVVLQRASHFEGRSRLLTWLTTIVLNRAKSYRRKGSRVQPFSGVFSRSEPQFVTDMTAERMVLEREQRQALDAAVHALPDRQRSVLRLHLQGYDAAESRQTLSITDLALRVRLSRARSRLREKLAPSRPEAA